MNFFGSFTGVQLSAIFRVIQPDRSSKMAAQIDNILIGWAYIYWENNLLIYSLMSHIREFLEIYPLRIKFGKL